MKKLFEEDMDLLDHLPSKRLAQMANELNSWKYPKEFRRGKSWSYDTPPISETYEWALIQYIESLIGRRLILRTWNKDMSDEEFTAFWHKNWMI